MNRENRYAVSASLYMLKEMKCRQEKVLKGFHLLERKAHSLRFRARDISTNLNNAQQLLKHTLKEAYMALAAMKFTNGESNALVLENIDEAQVRVVKVTENVSGVNALTFTLVDDVTVTDPSRFAGLASGGHRTVEAKRLFRKALKILVHIAGLRNNCLLFDEAIKSTMRKVNGIEKVILPKLVNTQLYITMEMDEREREEFYRIKMTKAKKLREQAAKLEKKESVSEVVPPLSGDGLVEGSRVATDFTLKYLSAVMQPLVGARLSMSLEPVGDTRPPQNWDDDDLLF